MKKIFLFLTAIIALLILITSFSVMIQVPPMAAGESQKDEAVIENTVSPESDEFFIGPVTDYRQLYGNILDECVEIINGNEDAIDLVAGGMGIREAAAWQEKDAALASIGYTIRDISGDGIPELIIGDFPQSSSLYGSCIFGVYTIQNDEPVSVLEGWGRNAWYLLGDGRLFNSGSSGAAYSCFGVYGLSQNGTETQCFDFYFTNETDETFSEIGVFHNTSGAWDVGSSERMDQKAEDFWAMEEPYFNQTQILPLTAFSDYPKADTGDITARFASDATNVNFVADSSEQQSIIEFTATETVNEFQVLSIDFVELNGTFEYHAKKLFDAGALREGQNFVLRLTFFGDMPSYAIAYKDNGNVTRYFAIEISGKDGSLQLIEI